jgi:hypothetical protein
VVWFDTMHEKHWLPSVQTHTAFDFEVPSVYMRAIFKLSERMKK